jgi:hypothetical protein
MASSMENINSQECLVDWKKKSPYKIISRQLIHESEFPSFKQAWTKNLSKFSQMRSPLSKAMVDIYSYDKTME